MRRGDLKITFELKNLRLEAVPERGGCRCGSSQAKSHDGQVAGDTVAVHAQIEPAKIDEDRNVNHVEPVADAAIEGQRSKAQREAQWIASAGGGDRSQHSARKTDRKSGIEESGAASHRCRCRNAE